MNIGINAHLLAFTENYRQAGLSRHIYELLANVPSERPADRFTAFVPNGPIPNDFRRQLPRNLKLSQSRLPTGKAPVRIAWEQTVLPVAALSKGLDLLHCPVNVRPFISPCPVVVTIHDLIFLRYPRSFHPAKQLYLRAMSGWSARHAAHVIAVSETTRKDAIELLGVPPSKVTTVYNGVGSQFRPIPPDQVQQFRNRNRLTGRTILYVGTLEPRKNITLLLKSFREILNDPDFGDVQLIIGGSKGWYYEEIFTVAEDLGLTAGDRLRFLGRVPDEDLPLWYNVAGVFAYPSRYEGFGLPPLEAMACGTPVVVSNTSSLPEVVGNAGITLNPDDISAWTTSLKKLLENSMLASEFRAKGLLQSKKFTWKQAAVETADVYRRILSPGRSKALRHPQL